MRIHLLRLGILASLLVFVTGLTGCGSDTALAPNGNSSSSEGGSSLPGNGPGNASSLFGIGLPIIDPILDGVGGTGIELSSEGLLILRTKTISAQRGGVVWAGRYKLTFPPGALTEDTEITIAQGLSDRLSTTFELLPHGIQFQKSVTLEVWMGDKLLRPRDDVRQYWWDESSGMYVDMGGDWSYPTLTTPIDHFSRWKAGRAGW